MSYFTDSPFERMMLQKPRYKKEGCPPVQFKEQPLQLYSEFDSSQSEDAVNRDQINDQRERRKSR